MLWNVHAVLSLFVYFVSQCLHISMHPSLHLVDFSLEIFLNFLKIMVTLMIVSMMMTMLWRGGKVGVHVMHKRLGEQNEGEG